MTMVSIEDGAGVLVHDERLGVASPAFGHLEQFIAISDLDFFVNL